MTLDNCLEAARKNNLQLQQSALQVGKAREVKAQAFTKYFPQVSIMAFGYQSLRPMVNFGIEDVDNSGLRDLLNTLYGNYGAAMGIDNHLSLFQHGVVAGVTALQPLYAGGQIVTGNRLAKLGIKAAELQESVAARDELWQVEEYFFLVLKLEAKRTTIAVADSMIQVIEKDVETAMQAGLAMKNDLLQVQLRQHELNAQQQELENGIRLARSALAQLVGISVDSIGQLIYEENDETLPDTLQKSHRSEEDLLRLQVTAMQLKRRMELGNSLPRIAVGAGYGYTNLFDKHSHNGTIFVTMQIPISSWGETAHKMKELDYDIKLARLQEQDLTQKMRLQENQLMDNVNTSKLKWENSQKTVDLAKENYRLSTVSYEAGLIPLSELMQAQTRWQQAENEHTDARIEYHIALRKYMILRN